MNRNIIASVLLAAFVACLLLVVVERIWGPAFGERLPRASRYDISAGMLAYFLVLGGVFFRLILRWLKGRTRPRRLQRLKYSQAVLRSSFTGFLAIVGYVLICHDGQIRLICELTFFFVFGLILTLPRLWAAERRGAVLRKITKTIGTFRTESLTRLRRAYDQRLDSTLRDILQVSSKTTLWTRLRRVKNRPTAILFAPDLTRSFFVPVAVHSPSRRYCEIAWDLRPPFLVLEKFCEAYSQVCKDLDSRESGNVEQAERLRQFRRSTRDFVSTCAIVAGRCKPFFFDGVFEKCITFDFSFLSKINNREEQNLLQFEQLVAIPARYNGRLLGVLLLLGSRSNRFVRDMSLYDQLQDLVGHLLDVGKSNDLLDREVIEALSDPPPFVILKSFSRLINNMNSQFSKPVHEDLVNDVRKAMIESDPGVDGLPLSRGPVRLSSASVN
jgi:hypothetical protein